MASAALPPGFPAVEIVDLDCQSVEMPAAVGDPLQWSVRDQAAIPIMLAFEGVFTFDLSDDDCE